MKWSGDMSTHVASYMTHFEKFRKLVCQPKSEEIFDRNLLAYRGQGYWIPELHEDVDVETIKTLLPEMEKKVAWIKSEREKVHKMKKLPTDHVTKDIRFIMKKLLTLKKSELSADEKVKTHSRKESLKLLGDLEKAYAQMIKKISFLTNYHYPIDHLKNRKVHDRYRDKDDENSIQVSNYTFLYRKILEDAAYNKDHTGSDIYLRSTLDTLYYELKEHGFYITEDARYDLQFILDKVESELNRGKDKIVERLDEWEDRSSRALSFYQSLTLPENQLVVTVGKVKTSANKQLVLEHNRAADQLKDFVYKKQAEVYNYWLHQPELDRALFVIETILLNEVGTVDGEDALERMDVARVIMNRLDKPKYLKIGKKEFIGPYLKKVTSDFHIQNEKWLNTLFKQGEFSFTYYYMGGVAKIFCPDMSPNARKLRAQNVEIALQVLKEGDTSFKTTRYFSRASMIGRIHMDSIWEDYVPYPERPGLLAAGQDDLMKAFKAGDYTFLYSFLDPAFQIFQVVEINGLNYALGEEKGVKLFFNHRNPHYFRYFTKTEI